MTIPINTILNHLQENLNYLRHMHQKAIDLNLPRAQLFWENRINAFSDCIKIIEKLQKDEN